MIRNETLQKRICILIAQTFAVSIDQVLADVKQIGIEEIIEKLENPENRHNY